MMKWLPGSAVLLWGRGTGEEKERNGAPSFEDGSTTGLPTSEASTWVGSGDAGMEERPRVAVASGAVGMALLERVVAGIGVGQVSNGAS